MAQNDWDMALGDQEMQAAQGALTELQNMDDSARKERETIMNRRRNHLAAAMDIADRNGGFVPTSILGALSNEFGFPVAGGNFAANGSFIVYENRAGENGTQQIVPKAIIGPMQGYKLLEKTGLGSQIRESMYGKFKKFRTAEQLARIGINPPVQSAPQAPEGATMTGDTAGRLAQRIMPERRGVSVFGTDGKGNWSSRTIDPATGEERGEAAGSRSQEYQGKWKVLESGPDGMRYENDKTGEVVKVPKGSTLSQVLHGGTTEKERIAAAELAGKERIAQMQGENQKEIAKMKSEADKEIAAMGGKNGKRGYTLEEKLKIVEAETERQLKVAKAKKEGGEQVQAIKTYAQLLKDPMLRLKLEKLGDEDANKFVETLATVMGLGENSDGNSGASSGAPRSAAEIRANPQDGDELPLKGGGKARYNGKTGKWEAAN